MQGRGGWKNASGGGRSGWPGPDWSSASLAASPSTSARCRSSASRRPSNRLIPPPPPPPRLPRLLVGGACNGSPATSADSATISASSRAQYRRRAITPRHRACSRVAARRPFLSVGVSAGSRGKGWCRAPSGAGQPGSCLGGVAGGVWRGRAAAGCGEGDRGDAPAPWRCSRWACCASWRPMAGPTPASSRASRCRWSSSLPAEAR